MLPRIVYIIFCCLIFATAFGQPNKKYWHGIERTQPYKVLTTRPGIIGSIVSMNGTRRFNRALYGTNTAFRVETGDLPEFALYMPGMGGNFKLGLVNGEKSKWLTASKKIIAAYYSDQMTYTITDTLLGDGSVEVNVMPCANKEGMLVSVNFTNIPNNLRLAWAYGGATGIKFSRDGDIGADPESSFYLQPVYCKSNQYILQDNTFLLTYGDMHNQEPKKITGVLPAQSSLKLVDAQQQQTPQLLLASTASTTPAIAGKMSIIADTTYYFLVQAGLAEEKDQQALYLAYRQAQARVLEKALRLRIQAPEAFMEGLDHSLSVAADAIWENPSYLHGAIAWRMRLPAWRGAYVADPLGWSSRARTHFSSYAKSQVISPISAPVEMDTALHLARHLEKIGTGMFTSGYICRNPNGDIRPHHYDMNLVFIDQLMNHFNWMGDTAYVKEMWPVIESHLAWEKRNFDQDGDGLYDAYCCIWASDALQYSGGGVTHSSAYNYRIFKTAGELATLIGIDGSAYTKESQKIWQAINRQLWMPGLGWYAEYKDLLGKKLVHPTPGIWTIYHALDAKLPDPFQAFQATRYVDMEIPHIPIQANGLEEDSLYLLSTSNWQPYTWSVNNVALAENLHMALAYWQANRPEEAYSLWKSALIESMYLGASPGGFQQLSFYDAIRGQLYRDFADPVGMAARTLVEGLFGIQPNALHDTLVVRPGFPSKWNQVGISMPHIKFNFIRNKALDNYAIDQWFEKDMYLKLQVRAVATEVASVVIDGKPALWKVIENEVGYPMLQVISPKQDAYEITIKWKGDAPATINADSVYANGDSIQLSSGKATIQSIYDPQKVLAGHTIKSNRLAGIIQSIGGNKTIFIKLKQGVFTWWHPICFSIKSPAKDMITVGVLNPSPNTHFEKINLTKYFNEKVTNIFKQNYLSPRPTSATLQLPTQGIGNWCYPLTTAEISDSGLRAQAGAKNEIILPQGIPFYTPGDSKKNNIIFTSQWENFPDSVVVPLSGKSSHAYMLMAGSTNPMQSRMVNGEVHINYSDGSNDILLLKNPSTWWPIEQDYLNDGYAFTTDGYQPLRYYLKKGIASTNWTDYITIRGFSNRGIDGGAATVLDLPLNHQKELKSIVIHSIANDVVIGLMSLTLVR